MRSIRVSDSTRIDRKRAAQLGQETVRFLEAGFYQNAAGVRVELGTLLERAVAGTCTYPPDRPLPEVPGGARTLHVEVRNESTLDAARRLAAAGARPVALNFASAKHPGGGFLGGARAQEESLARSSGLYACLDGNPMYAFHRAAGDPMYSHYAIYSPDVPVFRTDDGTLLEQPYLCAFLTSPAVNAKVVLDRDPSRRPAIRAAMRERIDRVLTIAAHHGHDALVLGAWGCGVFGNDGREIAELFREALHERYRGVFGPVVFAIMDWSAEEFFIGPFRRVFGS
jgi:uncharacterized protein (TIGR02452 family)